MRTFGYIVLLSFACCACFHRSKNTLCEIYTGTLPAASSIGIETTITFLPDGTFYEKNIYIGEKNGTFSENGTYTLKGQRITTVSAQGEKAYYRLEDEQIRRLDSEGNEITGALADFYILKCK